VLCGREGSGLREGTFVREVAYSHLVTEIESITYMGALLRVRGLSPPNLNLNLNLGRYAVVPSPRW
jgi:hypothetical protein